MQFKNNLITQLNLHPCMQPQDIVKLCYQAAFGAEHLLNDFDAAKKYFEEEYYSISAEDGRLYEEISDSVCRVNLAAWKYSGMPSDWLFRMFQNTAAVPQGGKELFLQNLNTAEQVLQNSKLSFTLGDWNSYLTQYQNAGMPSVHHSQIYRDNEQPAYRIVNGRFLRLLPLLQKLAILSHKTGTKTIAIDGRAASGKSTIAADLELILDAGIIHMDDFFLPLDLRSPERYAQLGGNIHYERFAEEVLPHLRNKSNFSYTIFDCSLMNYHGTHVVNHSEWRVVEGAYSCHPIFGDYADLKVFSDIHPEKQIERLIHRNGPQMAERFKNEWIPYEEKYYTYYKIKENADFIISTT